MNYLDELLAVYPERDLPAQRYLLASVGGHPLGLETDALLEFLWRETASEAVPLRHLARRQLGRSLPSCLRQAHGLEAARIGIWSSWAAGKQEISPSLVGAPNAETEARLLAAGWHRLSGLIDRALRLLDTGSPRVRLAASLVVGRVQTTSVLAALRASLTRGGKVSFLHAAALADLGVPETRDALIAAVRDAGSKAPDLALLLSDLGPDAFPTLAELARTTDELTLSNVVLALGSEVSPPARELLAKLARGRSSWVTAFALDALASHPHERDVTLAEKIFRDARVEFLKVQAVKLVGAVPGGAGVEFLENVLARGEPRTRAAALEALVRKKVDAQRMAAAAARDVASPVLKLRVNAMLVLAKTDPAAVQAALEELLGADDVVARVEAAFVLGYLRSPAATEVLGELALNDPTLPVRVQAIKSLSKHEPARSLAPLMAAVTSGHPRVAGLAARALAASPESGLEAAAEGLRGAALGAKSAVQKGVLLRAFGIAVSRRALIALVPDVLERSLGDAEEPVVLGALEGIRCLGGSPLKAVVKLCESGVSRVRHRASVAAFLEGHTDAVDAVTDLMDATEESHILSGLQAFLEIAILMPSALAAPQFSSLRSARAKLAEDRAVPEYSRKEDPRAAPEEPPRGRERPPVAAARFDPVPVEIAIKRPVRPAPGKKPSEKTLRRREAEAAGYLGGLPPMASGLVATLQTYWHLIAAVLMLMVPAVIVISRWGQASVAVESGRKRLEKGTLRVGELSGKAEYASPGRTPQALKPGLVIRASERVATGPGARLSLVDDDGNAVRLGQSSAVMLAPPSITATSPETTHFVFEQFTGDVQLDFSKGLTIEAIFERERLVGTGIFVWLRDGGDGRVLNVVTGSPEFWAPGSPPRTLKAPQTVKVAR